MPLDLILTQINAFRSLSLIYAYSHQKHSVIEIWGFHSGAAEVETSCLSALFHWVFPNVSNGGNAFLQFQVVQDKNFGSPRQMTQSHAPEHWNLHHQLSLIVLPIYLCKHFVIQRSSRTKCWGQNREYCVMNSFKLVNFTYTFRVIRVG